MSGVYEPQVLSLRTRDGVRLDADVYMPRGKGPFPVLLMRQPYGRRIASTVTYAHPSWYARQGYIVVIQDVRGRGSSGGEFEPFVDERADAAETLDWVAQLPGSNGRVGMYGFSYQGATQLFAAAAGHPALKAIAPAMTGFDLFRDWAYEGGAFRLYNGITWAAQLGAESARRAGDHGLYAQRYRLGHGPGGDELIDPASPAMRELLHGTFYDGWLDAPSDSPYWRERSAAAQPPALDLPALHIGGWFDSFLTGTLASYGYLRQGRAPQRMLIGPWTHLPWTPAVGSAWFGDGAQSPVDSLQLRWFDRFLKEQDNGVDSEPRVELYDLRAGGWRSYDDFPDPEPRRLYLVSNGRAGVDISAGHLAEAPGTGGHDLIIVDPWRPVPTVGGHLAPSAGIQDRTAVDARPDVATYTSSVFRDLLQLAGAINVMLEVSADADSFDLCAVLSVVDADGRARNLSQGYRRVIGPGGTHHIGMRGSCALIRPGERLRLSVSGSCYPAYALNDGSGRVVGATRATDYRILTLRLRPEDSWIELPCHAAAGIARVLP